MKVPIEFRSLRSRTRFVLVLAWGGVFLALAPFIPAITDVVPGARFLADNYLRHVVHPLQEMSELSALSTISINFLVACLLLRNAVEANIQSKLQLISYRADQQSGDGITPRKRIQYLWRRHHGVIAQTRKVLVYAFSSLQSPFLARHWKARVDAIQEGDLMPMVHMISAIWGLISIAVFIVGIATQSQPLFISGIMFFTAYMSTNRLYEKILHDTSVFSFTYRYHMIFIILLIAFVMVNAWLSIQ